MKQMEIEQMEEWIIINCMKLWNKKSSADK